MVIVSADRRIRKFKLLVDESPGCVVVADCEPGACKTIVRGRFVQQRYCRAPLQPAQVANLNAGGIRACGTRQSNEGGANGVRDQSPTAGAGARYQRWTFHWAQDGTLSVSLQAAAHRPKHWIWEL